MKPIEPRASHKPGEASPAARERRRARYPAAAFARTLLLRVCACVAAAAMSACALVPSAPDPAVATRQMQTRPERMIVLAVANPPESMMLRAGSTAGGYGVAGGYSPGGSARAEVAALAKRYGLREVSAWPIPSLSVHCAMLEIVGDTPRAKVLAQLAADPRVRLAQPLQTFDLLTNTPRRQSYAGLQYGYREIGADAAHRVAQGDAVRVAVIDTGIDTTHPELRGRVVATRNFVDDNWKQFNRDVHGTEVAGVIAAHPADAAADGADGANGADGDAGIDGIAPRAKLIAVKACWQSRSGGQPSVCNSFTLAEAIQAALDEHAQVINLSLGGPADPLLSKLVELSVKKGVVVVGAVLPDGNLNAFPVGVPGVIAVGAAGDDALADPAGKVLYAPGHDVLTLTPGGHYDFASGSSLAAASVTGTVALLLGVRPELDPRAIAKLLDSTSGPSRQHRRVINACRAIAALHRPCEDAEL